MNNSSVQIHNLAWKPRLTLGLTLVSGLGRYCASIDELRGQQESETVCCTGDSGMTSGSREVGCVPETHRALENSRHTTSQRTCIPGQKRGKPQHAHNLQNAVSLLRRVYCFLYT